MTPFAPLARLEIRHEFHGDAAPPIALEPDAATARIAARPDVRLRLSHGLAELFASDDRSALALIAADGALAFTFRLRPRDPALAAMTLAVAGARGGVVVLDPGPVPPGPLHAGTTVGEADLRPLDGAALATPPDFHRPPFAIVRLAVDPEGRDLGYSVRFGAVARFWTYHVIGGAPDAALGIRDREGALGFEPLGPRVMANGARAQSFRSSVPIAERARPVGRFELVSEGPFGPRVVLPVLPCPRPGPGVADPSGTAASEIFVNLW